MTPDDLRALGVRLVLLTAIGLAGWWFLALPARTRVEALRAELDLRRGFVESGRTELASAAASPHRIAAVFDERLEAYESFWNRTTTIEDTYDLFQSLAREHGIEIRQLNPQRAGRRVETPGERITSPALEVERFGASLDVRGEFADTAAFLRAVEERGGVARIDAFTMTPENNRGEIGARVLTTVSVSLARIRPLAEAPADARAARPATSRGRNAR